ncbi:MAG: von Willebrand factor type A domain-containing protein [Deltaproteobacteria bacterium]|nr:von Willebrand factor type A domain-containing protein [Deltaproteobacteria bacterium]
MDGKLCLLALPEEAELLFLASQTGSLHCALRNPDDIGSEEPRARATIETLLTGERVKALKKKRCATLQVIRGGPIAAAIYEGPAATNTEQYADHGVNGWVDTAADRLSTFAVDVDTAAYTIARRKLEQGALPPPEAVRTEEFINYFRYDYPRPDGNDAPFHVALEAAPSPFDSGRHILRVGLRGIDAGEQAHKPAHLTFLVDTSGSMQSADKIGMVKRSLRFLVDQLEDGDTVALCTYAGEVREVLRPTGMERRAEIHSAIEELSAGGSTAMASGLALAYALAYRNFQPDAINRVIVCSDGDANVGATEHGDMLESIAHFASAGITLSTVGFGMGNYKDHEMEQLADKGNGNYSYIDTFSQAKRVFGEQLMGTLQVIAKDVKVQVEFNPRTVTRYRLIGYENRDIADEDFREDKVDAGEIGAGHMVTALYEIESSNPRGHLATVRVRWKQPEGGRADERAFDLEPDHMAQDFEQASPDFKRAVAAAALAENLRNSPFKKTWTLEIAGRVAAAGAGQKADADDRELLAMIGKVQILTEKR